MKNKKTVSIFTLGCKLNFAESATILRQFTENGYEQVSFGSEADVIIINTCTVTSQADNKSKFAVKKAIKNSPNSQIVVIGCAAQVSTEKFERIEGVDLIVGAKDKFRIFELLQKHTSKTYKTADVFALKNFEHAFSLHERTRSFLKVQDGCDYVCSYCTIPKARGRSRNAPIEEIVAEAEKIASEGIKEIVLTGVNIGDFGKSTGETFLDLIKKLEKVKGIERYRISSIEPELLKDEIIDFTASSQKFMPHFHIPLQSGSDKILRLMQRRYNTKLFYNRINTIVKKIPDVFLGIDVIVGFPGETDKDFADTYDFLKNIPFAYLHIFPYSDRKGTKASLIKQKVNPKLKDQRVKILHELSDKNHSNFINKFLGKEKFILVENSKKNDLMFGFTDNYIKTAIPCDETLKNKIIKVKLLENIEGIYALAQPQNRLSEKIID